MPKGDRTRADDAIALGVASGKTLATVATECAVSLRTVHRRLADPAFVAHVGALRQQMVSAAAGRLAEGMTAAADELRALVENNDPALRFKASAKLIELALRARDDDLARRLAVVEAILRGEGANHAGDSGEGAESGGGGEDPDGGDGGRAEGLQGGPGDVDGTGGADS